MTVPEGSPDRRPGCSTSLQALHALVPAAEEVDLADEAHRARERRLWSGTSYSLEAVEDDPVPEDVAEPDAPELSERQVVGLLEHVLGAEVIEVRPHRP